MKTPQDCLKHLVKCSFFEGRVKDYALESIASKKLLFTHKDGYSPSTVLKCSTGFAILYQQIPIPL